MSEPKARADALSFAFIGFPHTENVAGCATRGVAHDHHAPVEQAIPDDTGFAIVPAVVLDL
jgi:hypothetical protein